jgi:Trk K+ transport system NAD-binding subunit
MDVVLIGRNEELLSALESEGASVRRITGVASGEALSEAGIEEADLLVLTDVAEATAIPVARELNGEVRIAVYAEDTLPEFAQPLADIAVDPDLLSADVVAEELVGNG